ALAEIGQQIGAYFMRWDAKNFGYDTYEQYHPSEALYFIDQAQQIVRNMEQDSVLQAKTRIRTQYSNQWIYEHQLKILL
ncbi:MAG: glycosyltransferase, partial [Lachnospiraceae bacterium]